MKTLELKQMELIDGGIDTDCILNGTGAALGIGVLIIGLGIASGGVGFAVAGLLWSWGGSAITVAICSNN